MTDHSTFHPPDKGSAATTMKTTYVLQDLTRAWQWPIGKGLPEAMADFSKGAAQGRASDETTLALHGRPALPSWGIFFSFFPFFLFVITEETRNGGR